jgi:hypothetical protein
MKLELIKSKKKPKILGYADEEKKRTKPRILGEANEQERKNDSIKKIFSKNNEPENESDYEPTSSVGAFSRAAGRAMPDMISNVLNKAAKSRGGFFDLINKNMHPQDYNQSGELIGEETNLTPKSFQEKSGDRSHPIAELLGGITGGIPLLGGTLGAARSTFPAWSNIAKNAAGSFLRRAGVGATEGAGIGALYSKPGEALKEGAIGAALGGIGYAIVPILIKAFKEAPQKFKNIRDIDKLRDELIQLGLSKDQAYSAIQMAKSKAHTEFGSKSIEGLEHQLNNRMTMQNRLSNELEQHGKPIEQSEIPSEISGLPPINEPTPPEIEKIPAFESLAAKIKSILEQHTKNLSETEKNISEKLGEGQIFHERFATIVKEKRNALETINDKNYEKVDAELDKHPVTYKIKDDKKLKTVIKEIKDAIKKYKLSGKSADELMDKAVSDATKLKTFSSKDLLNLYRKTRNESFDSLMTSKMNPHTDVGERAYQAYKELQKISEDMYSLLKNNIPEDVFKELESAQSFFKENIAPMRKNTTFNEIKNKGKVSGNLIEKTIGSEEGQNILQKMISEDPELKRLSVGQSFAKNPTELHNPNEALEKHFFPGMPWLTELLEQHKGIGQEINKTKNQLEHAQITDKAQQDLVNKIAEQNLKLQQEHVAQLKAHENAKTKREESLKPKITKEKIDKSIKLKQDMKDNESKISGLEQKIKELKKLRETQNEKSSAYKATEQKLSEIENDIAKLKSKAFKTTVIIASLLGSTAAIKALVK